MTRQIISYIFIIFLATSCSRYPADVERALQLAGDNRPELEKVLEHYRQHPEDNQKYRAACFLIANMPGLFGYHSHIFDIYKEECTKPPRDHLQVRKALDSLERIYTFNTVSFTVLHDLHIITAEYLIKNIDMAFAAWQKPWAKHIGFDDFCNYILPYRIGNEPLEDWREDAYKRYMPSLEAQTANLSAVEAATVINDELKKEWKFFFELAFMPHWGYASIQKAKMGSCKEGVDWACYAMRAVGIPVGVDFVIQWPRRNHRHLWNFVIDKNNKSIIFLGGEENPGYYVVDQSIFGKVYRNTYSLQKGFSLQPGAGYRLLRYIDVSDQYFDPVDIRVELNISNKKNEYAYMSVFNNQTWVPVHYGQIKESSVVFKNVQKDLALMAFVYNDGIMIPASDPVLVYPDGSILSMAPDTVNTHDVTLRRKYYLGDLNIERYELMRGGKFQGANHPDFRDADDLYVIEETPMFIRNAVYINNNNRFRYVRYLPPEDSWSTIAELAFYGNQSDSIPLEGKITGVDCSFLDLADRTLEHAFDNDILSWHESCNPNGGWVGLDLGSPQQISKITFSPRNDDNDVRPGDQHCLYYRIDGHWQLHSCQIAQTDSLIFKNVPTNALLLLRNHTRGQEERPFSYENGKQVWW